MTLYTSQKDFSLSTNDLERLIKKLKVVNPPFKGQHDTKINRQIYFNPQGDADYILVTKIKSNVIITRTEKYPTLIGVISNNQKISNSIINKVSENVGAINKKEVLEAKVK